MIHPAQEIDSEAEDSTILAKVYETLTDPNADNKLDSIVVIEKCKNSEWQRKNHAERGNDGVLSDE